MEQIEGKLTLKQMKSKLEFLKRREDVRAKEKLPSVYADEISKLSKDIMEEERGELQKLQDKGPKKSPSVG